MKIAILTPSRNRPKELFRFFKSVADNASQENKIYFLFGIDSDDPSKRDYCHFYSNMVEMNIPNMIINMVIEDRRPIGFIWNDLAKMKGWYTSPDIFIMGNDDLVYKTKNWDKILVDKIRQDDHPFYCYWFDDGINGEKHCAFPIVTKHWVGGIGYFAPEIFRFFYHDTWVFDIATKMNCLRYIPEIQTQHMHFSQGNNIPYDNTYAQWRTGDTHKHDTELFRKKEDDRLRTAEYLQERIKNFLAIQNAEKEEKEKA